MKIPENINWGKKCPERTLMIKIITSQDKEPTKVFVIYLIVLLKG